ncbi:transposase [Pelotomaculum terephthalicicum JT]|uniref:REP-associated tyrosine transposase n=1 Tax=Pelotomaculum terephthalicicum TaxID=206393 RepID=UPI001F043886|nr:transposase [Pelotomaculum terephthalicicum]MCG9967131.1 transposase [Pelotomaculum terephthalicicum JT]
MPRKARILSESEVYHVMLRGNERKDIFLEEENKQRIIDTLLEKRKKSGFSLYAYCVMNNHAHFIIRTKDEPISIVFKRIGTSYAYYYNNKHNRVGHVFQDRFKSENIADDKYLITAVRYIHNNPVKARICQSAMNYKWSSIDLYLNYEKGLLLLPEISDVLSIFSDDISIAKTKFIEFMHITLRKNT